MNEQKLTTVSVIDFLYQVAKNKATFDVCYLNENSPIFVWLKDKENFRKVSASPSDIQFGKLVLNALEETEPDKQLPISMKIFKTPIPDDPQYENLLGLQYEAKMYRLILEKIVLAGYSPNFISFVGYGCCNNGKCILITERAGNGTQFGLRGMYPVSTLKDVLSSDITRTEFKTILFQIMYNLQLLNMLRIMHGDMHFGNILVVNYGEKITLNYIVDRKSFVVKTKYIVYFFDWDLSYTEELGDNPKISFLKQFNMKNEFNPYYDIYTVLCSLETIHVEKGFQHSLKLQPATKAKEEKLHIEISADEYEALSNLVVYATKEQEYALTSDDKPAALYKLSKTQIYDIVEDAKSRGIPSDVFEIYFYLTTKKRPQKKYFMVFWNPFKCRLTTTSKNIPTPLDYLRKPGFESLLEKKHKPRPFVYRIPESIHDMATDMEL